MRFLRQSLTGLVLLAITLGVLFYAGITVKNALEARMAREARPPQSRERVFSVNVVTARESTEQPVLTAYGEVQSSRTLDIRAAVGGTVIWLAPGFVDGGRVEKGAPLLRIDPANAQSALDRAESTLLDARAEARDGARALAIAKDELIAAEDQAKLRERAFERARDLRTRGVGTDAAVETAELAAAAARAAVLAKRQALAQAEARIDQAATLTSRAEIAREEAQRDLADTEIAAGFSGTLSDVIVVEGGLVSANEKLATLVDADALEVAFRLSTQGYARLLDAAGNLTPAPVRAVLASNGTGQNGAGVTANGRLARASAQVGEGQTGRLVYAQLERARGFKPGDFVTVEIEEAPLTGVYRLPAGALGPGGDVLILGADDRLETVEVRLERRQGDEVLVRAQALEGKEVVTRRSPLLGAGIKVKPIRAAGAGEAAPEQPEMLELSEERRAKLVAFVEGNSRMPDEAKARLLAQLAKPQVPAATVERIESRIGG
ncbi:efflux RND transporter periplasmic adaptor subunit [Rhodalgimonas zhirmunskyi]|uniref:Efflux transporter periplasmic adaptor subunit n=1 Tax=Rhodalgimonas zhirmunskyi TaxID=2964767 RepID=A0AAJ1UC29_9RHOB|nr:efflux transporter periplasmic adaptor subunit [Rhodoalgimonas zhirmunskyi]MDQ2093821.1 efflux transporter periplasmic adaptor subunit [Rhodoalgimonas zhirmunskyi]